METSKIITHLFLILFFCCLYTPSPAQELCSSSFCRTTEPIIHFPFRLENLQQPSCGYPGFNLFCDAFNQTLIELPNSGKFTVQAIDYAKQKIWLNDPDYCLPKRLLELNFSGSPFNGVFSQDFTLFNCTFGYRRYRFNPINCMSGEHYTVVASSSERAIRFLAARCSFVATVAVPVQWNFFEPVMTSDLSDDIRLTWASPHCGRCESRGGQCGFRSINTTAIQCRNAANQGLARGARYAIIVGALLPAFLCLVGLFCFFWSRLKNYYSHHHHHHRRPAMEFSMAVAPQPTTTTVPGLDDPTIQSYPKTILGESCRLPNPDDIICSICLSEYMPKETLRTIPECQHSFHAQCIDEWLRLNPSCPVCRTSPKSSPITHTDQ